MVEFQPSKLAAWVRFPSPAPLKKAFFGALSSFLYYCCAGLYFVPAKKSEKTRNSHSLFTIAVYNKYYTGKVCGSGARQAEDSPRQKKRRRNVRYK